MGSLRASYRSLLKLLLMRIFFTLVFSLVAVVFGAGSDHADLVNARAIPSATPPTQEKGKKNSRPSEKSASGDEKETRTDTASAPVYYYEFVRPGFLYGHVWIEHDEQGHGTISFLKDGDDEKITDPIALSPVTMVKIKQVLTDLDFLNSTEEYQYERDFSNLGNITFTVRRNGRERTVKYNWTSNKNAKDLMDEYRRIVNQYTWLFEFSVARVNQPLRTPGMMDALDGFLRRKEIPHAPHLLPFLSGVSTDEKLPLIARNHASRLIKQIEKSQK